MYLSRRARLFLRLWCAAVLVVLYAPILYVARLSLNTAQNFAWPPSGFTLTWWRRAAREPGPRLALLLQQCLAPVRGRLAQCRQCAGSPAARPKRRNSPN